MAHKLPEKFMPREVEIAPGIASGEIHVMPDEFALYWTQPEGRAIRYSVGVGRDDLYHAGSYIVQMKREWPSWKPTPAMIRREPEKYETVRNFVPWRLLLRHGEAVTPWGSVLRT